MTLCTAALYAAYPAIKAFGCCHEVFGTQWHLANLVERWFNVPKPVRQEIVLDINGINHFTFATAAHWQGVDLFPHLRKEISRPGFFRDRTREAQKRKRDGQWFHGHAIIGLDLMARFGVLGAAGDRHLAEFVPWYLSTEAALHRWGEVLTPYSYRLKRARESQARFKLPKKLEGSNEEAVPQLLAVLGLGALDTNVNLPNVGQNPDLPFGAVVESYAQLRRDSVKPVVSGALPPVLAGHLRRLAENQQVILEAALECDKDLAFQALLNDPLVHLPTDAAWTMFNQMLRHTKTMLPGWKIA
jgi:alpha-galactosidase